MTDWLPLPAAATGRKRCAVYIRTSDIGLDRGVALAAEQRERCTTYIKGLPDWWLVGYYEDHRFCARDTDRPALQVLLSDIADGYIDVLVVDKFDCLSCSLLEFTMLITQLDVAGVELVSVTQDVSTAAPLGRATAHVLVSIAARECAAAHLPEGT
jgi:DNA invertase Pin-like site-specific DNA recombinase